MSSARTTFVVCTRNNRDIIDACLGSIDRQTDSDWDLIVVDDESTDGTPDYIEATYPRAKVVRRAPAQGPSINRNAAIAMTTSRFIATLDSDVELDTNWLAMTRSYLETHDDVGIVGGKLLYAANPTVINSYGGQTGWIGIGWDGHEGRPASELTEPEPCLWVCSAAMLARRDVLTEVGGFDETFFYGYEDSDLGWRVNLYGYRCICIPEAVAYHRARTTIGKMGSFITFHYHKNRLRSVLKNAQSVRLFSSLPVYGAYSLVDLVLRGPRWAKLRAWWWSLVHLPETLALRRTIQASRRRSDVDRLIQNRILPPIPLARRAGLRTPENKTPPVQPEAQHVS